MAKVSNECWAGCSKGNSWTNFIESESCSSCSAVEDSTTAVCLRRVSLRVDSFGLPLALRSSDSGNLSFLMCVWTCYALELAMLQVFNMA